ncbi:MAG: O-antigen ligase family protein, partial [Deltaproteobacteria bacterium]
MSDKLIKLILMSLLVFTPVAFGSMELWAFSLMELGILLIIILGALQNLIGQKSEFRNPCLTGRHAQSAIPLILLSLFLLLVLFQIFPLPSGILKTLSPKTYELRHQLLLTNDPLRMTPLSFVPFATRIEFFKWLALAGLFLFLLRWKVLHHSYRITGQLIVLILMVGVAESLYGIFEFFSGHRHILHLDGSSLMGSVTGTFINRNYFAGYLLMVVPLSAGYLFSRGALQRGRSLGWRHWLSSLDGKTLLIAFGVIVMILGLLFSASRMGILCLLLSFGLISFLFRNPRKGEGVVSKTSVLIFVLALLWALWIGLDAVFSRFFTASEDFKSRWMIWVNTFRILQDYPLFGSGLGTFTQVFPMYRSFHIRGLVTHAENDFLQLASEVGL